MVVLLISMCSNSCHSSIPCLSAKVMKASFISFSQKQLLCSQVKKHFVPLLRHLGLSTFELGCYLFSLKLLEPLKANNQALRMPGTFIVPICSPATHKSILSKYLSDKWLALINFFLLFPFISQVFCKYWFLKCILFVFILGGNKTTKALNKQKIYCQLLISWLSPK